MQKINSENMKQSNTELILQLIAQNVTISRADISRLTGLNKATVSEITKTLIEKNLVVETGDSKQTGGRKAKLLTFNKQAATVFAIDFELDCLVAVIADLYGGVLYKTQVEVVSKNLNDEIELLYKLIDKLLVNNPKTYFGVIGIGISVRGFVTRKGTLKYVPYYDWHDVDMKKLIETTYNIPTIVGNDSNLFAVGENRLHHNAENLLGINISSGVGLGVIIDGEMYTGADGFAGEIGHMIVEPNGRKCTCGNMGCLEQYVSELAIVQRLSSEKGEKLSIDDFTKLVIENDQIALNIFSDFVLYMAVCLNNVSSLFNPNAIVIYSEIFNKLPKTIELVKQKITSKVFNASILTAAQNRGDAILFGATLSSVANYFGIDCVVANDKITW